jgi:hypothetical protein
LFDANVILSAISHSTLFLRSPSVGRHSERAIPPCTFMGIQKIRHWVLKMLLEIQKKCVNDCIAFQHQSRIRLGRIVEDRMESLVVLLFNMVTSEIGQQHQQAFIVPIMEL